MRGVLIAWMLWLAGTAAAVAAGQLAVYRDGFEDVTPHLLLRYSFESSAANTGSVPGLALTTANTSYGSGKFGSGLTFGAGGYATVDGTRAILGALSQVTIAFWLYEPSAWSGGIWDDNNRSTSPYGGVQLGRSGSSLSLCVSTTSNNFLSGMCNGPPAPSTGAWHHYIIRYDAVGTGAGEGGNVELYVDGAFYYVRHNDAMNDPVFNPGIPDTMYIGSEPATMDELLIFDRVYGEADQCTLLTGGTWNGVSCTLP